MNPVLSEIIDTGITCLPSGESTEITGSIDPTCGKLLQRTIREISPRVCLEVGLAFGVSTLYILEALRESGGHKLIGMDPAQFDGHWRGGGLYNIQRAGYGDLYEFHENTSQQILPRLAGDGLRIDFAFIDGWHTFDHTLVDFFYIDQMLNTGGIVVFDDVGYPAIRRLSDFIITNRAYEIFDSVTLHRINSFSQSVKISIKDILSPLCRTDKTPSPDSKAKLSRISDVYFLALRKCSDDNRRWDHFLPF